MEKLERLIQDDFGNIYRKDKPPINKNKLITREKISTFVFENPVLDIENEINNLVKKDSSLIPKSANCYTASEFNPNAQFSKNEKMYSVYAVQFYYMDEY